MFIDTLEVNCKELEALGGLDSEILKTGELGGADLGGGLLNHVKIIVFALSFLTILLLCFIKFIIFDFIKGIY